MTTSSLFNEQENYGIPQQQSRCRIVVYSHITSNEKQGIVDCSNDVIACETGKSIKDAGSATFVLVPRFNYFGFIFPDDWVNIYFDPGDGRGYIRTFFGLVDRITRTITTDTNGATETRFQVIASDFTKIFDKTNIYFNPHIGARTDFLGNFAGSTNITGSALRTKGLLVYGSPADIVLSMAHVLLGFGTQFKIPKSLLSKLDMRYVEANRKYRREWAKDLLPDSIKAEVGAGYVTEYWNEKTAELSKQISDVEQGADTPGPVTKDVIIQQLRAKFAAKYQSNSVVAALQADKMSVTGAPVNFLDLIDFSFIEYKAIDGFISSASVWEQQGTIWSSMNSFSNEIVTELFCDLRPIGEVSDTGDLLPGGYNSEADELGLNTNDSGSSTFAVRFSPALIMREYPFSTIEGVDASNAELLGTPMGFAYFGAIFSQGRNEPGRKVVKIATMNDWLRVHNPGSWCRKHLDVAVVSVKDIISENIGRSDGTVINLIEVYSNMLSGDVKFLTQDVQPIVNPVSIERHGLRPRKYDTRFAQFSSTRTGFQTVDCPMTRWKVVRWALLLDHWYQHEIEYLNGSISTRAFPEIRVGYRLDIKERNESYYVEGVNHSWHYPNALTSAFTLSRGQRNDPYPVYVKPAMEAFGGKRGDFGSPQGGRLADFFDVKDTSATRNAMDVRSEKLCQAARDRDQWEQDTNLVDIPDCNKNSWGGKPGYLCANSAESITPVSAPELPTQTTERQDLGGGNMERP